MRNIQRKQLMLLFRFKGLWRKKKKLVFTYDGRRGREKASVGLPGKFTTEKHKLSSSQKI